MNKEGKCILVCVQSMWGALEWILPAMKYIRENHGEITVLFLINRMYKNEFFGSNKKLQLLTDDISGRQCFDFFDLLPDYSGKGSAGKDYRQGKLRKGWHRFIWKILKKRLAGKFMRLIQPDVVLMDIAVHPFYGAARKTGSIRVGNFLTAPSFSLAPHIWTDRDILKKRVIANSGFDFYLVDNDYSRNFYSEIFPDKQVSNIGCPKFDSEWLAADKGFFDTSADRKKNNERKIVVLLKNESSAVFQHSDFSGLLHDIFTVCSRVKGASLILKPHPRQDIVGLEAIMRQFPELPAVISNESVMTLAADAQLLISMPSGIILDAVLTGRPVIEYFDFLVLNERLRRYSNEVPRNIMGGIGCMEHGKITSVFRHENFVYGADTMEQLEKCIERVGQEAESKALANLRKIYPDNAAEKTAEVILEQMEHNEPSATNIVRTI